MRDTPPVENGKSRFGNPAFRTFYDRVNEVRIWSLLHKCAFPMSADQRLRDQDSRAWHQRIPGLESAQSDTIDEVRAYFDESWGNRTRVDYGSGMELNFIAWL